jgi:putative thioredoxin
VLRRSLTVPVLVDFWAEWCGPCKQLSPVLERLAQESGGTWALAKVDVDSNQQLAGSLQIQSIPTILLALGGRLIQGFTGALPEADLRSFIDQVLGAAAQAGLPGAGAVPDDQPDAPVGPPPEPEVLQAEEALERGDYAGAEAAYDALLARRPGDPLATAGRASIALFRRTESSDPETVLTRAASAPDDVEAQLAAADLEVIADRVEEAVARLVGLVRRTSEADRDAARTRLLELFAVLDPEDPRVIKGRRDLASALF